MPDNSWPRGTIDGDSDWHHKFDELKSRILIPICQEHGWPSEIVPHVRGYDIWLNYPRTNLPFRSKTEHGPVTQLMHCQRGAWNALFYSNREETAFIDWHVTSLDIFRAFERDIPPIKSTGSRDRVEHWLKIWDINQFSPSFLIAASPGVWDQINWRQGDLGI